MSVGDTVLAQLRAELTDLRARRVEELANGRAGGLGDDPAIIGMRYRGMVSYLEAIGHVLDLAAEIETKARGG